MRSQRNSKSRSQGINKRFKLQNFEVEAERKFQKVFKEYGSLLSTKTWVEPEPESELKKLTTGFQNSKSSYINTSFNRPPQFKYNSRYGYFNDGFWFEKKLISSNLTIINPLNEMRKIDLIYEVKHLNLKQEDLGIIFEGAFEHALDTGAILKLNRPTLLRGLIIVKDEIMDIEKNKTTKKLCQIIKKLEDEAFDGILILPDKEPIKNPEPPTKRIFNNEETMKPEQPKEIKTLKDFYDKFNKENNNSKGYYLYNGYHEFYLKKLRGILRSFENQLFENFNIKKELQVNQFFILVKILMNFIKVNKEMDPKVSKLVYELLKPYFLNLKFWLNTSELNLNDQKLAKQYCAKLILNFSNILNFQRDLIRPPRLIITLASVYTYLLECINPPKRPFYIIIPQSLISYTIYTDGSYNSELRNESSWYRSSTTFETGTFAGLISISTQHILTQWKYRIDQLGLANHSAELYGVIFSLLICHQKGILACIRCDNTTALQVIDQLFKIGFKAPLVISILNKDPKLLSLLKIIHQSNIARQCRLEWVRAHTFSTLNILVDRLTSHAYFTGQMLVLDDMLIQSEKVSQKIQKLNE